VISSRTIRHCSASVLTLLFVASAHAQTQATTDKLDIWLRGSDCPDVTKMSVVMQDDDAGEIPARKEREEGEKEKEGCHWTATTAPDRFRTNLTHFSLRLSDFARTNCRMATWDETRAKGQLKFQIQSAPSGPAQQIEIRPDPTISLPYAREVKPSIRPDIFCTETGILPATVHDVQFGMEKVRLRLFDSKKDVCGLVVNKLPAIAKATKKKGSPVPANRSEVVDALTKLRHAGDACSMPNLSSAAIDINDRALGKRGLASLLITVK
jgi:hypothetical protein